MTTERFMVDTTDPVVLARMGGTCSGCGLRIGTVRCRKGPDGAFYTTERSLAPAIPVGHRLAPENVLGFEVDGGPQVQETSHARKCYLAQRAKQAKE